MSLIISMGSGRARCRICGDKISQREIDVELVEYQMERHFHGNCMKRAINNFVPSDIHIFERYSGVLPEKPKNVNKDRIK